MGGIQAANRQYKISLYADDVLLFIQHPHSSLRDSFNSIQISEYHIPVCLSFIEEPWHQTYLDLERIPMEKYSQKEKVSVEKCIFTWRINKYINMNYSLVIKVHTKDSSTQCLLYRKYWSLIKLNVACFTYLTSSLFTCKMFHSFNDQCWSFLTCLSLTHLDHLQHLMLLVW